MAMNSSGPISLGGATAGQSINLENGNSATAQVSLNDTAVRNLAGVASGAITMPTNFYGKSNIVNISYTFSTNTADAALNLSSISGYSAGKSNITVTVNSGVYLYSTSTGSYGLNISGGTTGDTLTIVNNGYIMGMGGGGGTYNTFNGSPGGPAINLNFGMTSCTINNTNASAYIGGGGGGGGVGGGNSTAGGGGGVGGGAGGPAGPSCPGGSGGGVGASGQNGTTFNNTQGSGGGGGRVFPGVGAPSVSIGASTAGAGLGGNGGASGGAGTTLQGSYTSGAGGSGSSAGGDASGSGGKSGGGCGGGGGGWGATGGIGIQSNAPLTRPGGSGGKAVNLNGKTVTWTSGNTTRVYGAVS